MDQKIAEFRKIFEGIKNDKYREPMLKLYDDYALKMAKFPAAIRYHHKWEGGLFDHTQQVVKIALKLYDMMEKDMRERAVTRDDVIITAFIHDLEKTTKYRKNTKDNGYEFEWNNSRTDANDTAMTVAMAARHGIHLSNTHLNALTFSHGGWAVDQKGNMLSLAVIIHTADLISTRIYGNKR